MKLLVCDVEGTIFQPHKIKSAQHDSYIWTAIAERLGEEAEREEIKTQEKWREGVYGPKKDGNAYLNWINDSIKIHIGQKLGEKDFVQLIGEAPYTDGVVEFFARLDRSKYIPVLISGGIQNLNERACRELGIDLDNSYAACKYFFTGDDVIDGDLTFTNTCDFYGKHELVRIALRKYGLGKSDWVFIGDGINDVSVSKWAASQAVVSIGINPVEAMRKAATRSYDNFSRMMEDKELMDKMGFLADRQSAVQAARPDESALEAAKRRVYKQLGNLELKILEKKAIERLSAVINPIWDSTARKFSGIEKLLEHGELSISLVSGELRKPVIVSALLQPFSNAAEIMIFVYLALTAEEKYLKNLLNKNFTLRSHRRHIDHPDLEKVMDEYFHNRNTSAHTSQEISLDAAQTFIRRTYEIIQRLELLINDLD